MAKDKKLNDKQTVPYGWILSGANPSSYQVTIDNSECHSGTRCAYMRHQEGHGEQTEWGTFMQQVGPDNYLGKRLRMSVWLKTKKIDCWVAPWMRVDGEKEGEMLSFDNMCKRQIKSASPWTKYEIVLDVPKESTNIAFGVVLCGKGHVWIDDFSFQEVGRDVRVTDCPCSKNSESKSPINLNFEDSEDEED